MITLTIASFKTENLNAELFKFLKLIIKNTLNAKKNL